MIKNQKSPQNHQSLIIGMKFPSLFTFFCLFVQLLCAAYIYTNCSVIWRGIPTLKSMTMRFFSFFNHRRHSWEHFLFVPGILQILELKRSYHLYCRENLPISFIGIFLWGSTTACHSYIAKGEQFS